MIFLALMEDCPLHAAETAEQLIAGAKKEGDEIVFVAGAQTFGGRKGLAELETGFNKKYGLKAQVSFAAGPDMNARAARLITEVKAGRKSSTDLYLGSQSHFALLHKENALETVNYSGIFPWVTKEMEIFPGEGLLVYTSPNGIIYNSNLIPKDKAPKKLRRFGRSPLEPELGGKDGDPTLRRMACRAIACLGPRESERLCSQSGCPERRKVALQRRGARRQRRVSHHGEYRRRAGSYVDLAG
jgi:hypothetical protein